jgi:ABC-type nitrate/sulfonate/bicarbonate transport system permease component
VGLLAGIAIAASSTLVYDSFYPALIGFNSYSKRAYVVPILVIWFGCRSPFPQSLPPSSSRSFRSW